MVSPVADFANQDAVWRLAQRVLSAICSEGRVAPISRWLTTERLLLNRYSIRSSMVRMCPVIVWLRNSSMDASVVLFAGAGGAHHQDQTALLADRVVPSRAAV